MRLGYCALLRYEARKKSKTRAREMKIAGAIISVTQLQLVSVLLLLSLLSCSSSENALKRLTLEYPVVTIKPVPLTGYKNHQDSKDVFSCERVQVAGLSRLELSRYASSFSLTLAPSADIPERLHTKIKICLHRNDSLGLCQCENDEWRAVYKGVWNTRMSPYEDKYVDVKFVGGMSGSVAASVEEEFQQWRFICLAVGFVLLFMAPLVSSWVPFYYSSSMAIGVLLVVIILLFQGMKLLPTGRKNILYLTVYGSVLGAGSFLWRHFSDFINSILISFGLSEDMHSPVSILALVGVVLAGAALGYWIVRRYVISKDGSVDVGVAQFVKWALRLFATTFILQSTIDIPLALGTTAMCWMLCSLLTSLISRVFGGHRTHLRKTGQATPKHTRAEFHSPPGTIVPRGKWYSPRSTYTWSASRVKGSTSPPSMNKGTVSPAYYSTFHKVPNRRRFSRREWEKSKQESTRQAMAELTASPKFAEWVIENADRIQILPEESSDETNGSGGSASTENETAAESGNKLRFLNW